MKKWILNIALLIAIVPMAMAQNSLSFYHLGNGTFQNNHLNPALIPQGKVFIGLPGLSGIHLGLNNKFNFNDYVVESTVIDGVVQRDQNLESLLSSLQKNNMLNVTADISWLHFGIVTRRGNMISLFANERIEADLLYDKSLIQFAVEGNGSHLGETFKIGKTRMNATHWREFGLGYAFNIPDADLTVGVRAKYLQGNINASTDPNFTANLTTDPIDFTLNLELQNGTLRTSGIDAIQGNNAISHLIFNGNMGGAIDIGFNKAFGRRINISGSLLDLGMISWKDDIKNHHMADTTMTFRGINLKNPDNMEQFIKDSLLNKFKNRRDELTDAYNTVLNPKLYLSGSYAINKSGEVVGTLGSRYVQGQPKLLLGAGYRHRLNSFVLASVNVTKMPQQFLDLGASIVIDGGPVQFFIAADQVMIYDARKFDSFDMRVGLSFVFGKYHESKNNAFGSPGRNSGPTSNRFLGNRVNVRGQEGIYTVIKKQHKRDKVDYELLANPMPDENPRLKRVMSLPPDAPTENPNLYDKMSKAPPANLKNPNQKRVKSVPPVNRSNQKPKAIISASGRAPNDNPRLNKIKSDSGRRHDKNPRLNKISSVAPNNSKGNTGGKRVAPSSPGIPKSKGNKKVKRSPSKKERSGKKLRKPL